MNRQKYTNTQGLDNDNDDDDYGFIHILLSVIRTLYSLSRSDGGKTLRAAANSKCRETPSALPHEKGDFIDSIDSWRPQVLNHHGAN